MPLEERIRVRAHVCEHVYVCMCLCTAWGSLPSPTGIKGGIMAGRNPSSELGVLTMV